MAARSITGGGGAHTAVYRASIAIIAASGAAHWRVAGFTGFLNAVAADRRTVVVLDGRTAWCATAVTICAKYDG